MGPKSSKEQPGDNSKTEGCEVIDINDLLYDKVFLQMQAVLDNLEVLNQYKSELLQCHQEIDRIKQLYEAQIDSLSTKNLELESTLKEYQKRLLHSFPATTEQLYKKEIDRLITKNAVIEDELKKCEQELLKCHKEKDSMRELHDKQIKALRRKRETNLEDSTGDYKTLNELSSKQANNKNRTLCPLQKIKYRKETYEMQLELINENMKVYLEEKQKDLLEYQDFFDDKAHNSNLKEDNANNLLECVREKDNMIQKYQKQRERLNRMLEEAQIEIDNYNKKLGSHSEKTE